jgi:hypothetical protein
VTFSCSMGSEASKHSSRHEGTRGLVKYPIRPIGLRSSGTRPDAKDAWFTQFGDPPELEVSAIRCAASYLLAALSSAGAREQWVRCG